MALEDEGEIKRVSFEDRIENGELSPDDARKEHERFTGSFVRRAGEGIVVDVHGAEITFQNAAEMFRWVNATGGIIIDQHTNRVIAGQHVDAILARLNKN